MKFFKIITLGLLVFSLNLPLVAENKYSAENNKGVEVEDTSAPQVSEIRSLFKKYSSSEDVEFIEISGSILSNLLKNGANKEDIKGISKIEILIISKDTRQKVNLAKSINEEFVSKLGSDYEKLLSVKTSDEKVGIFSDKNKSNIISITNNDSEMSVISISGNIANGLIEMILKGEIKLSN